jgi:hypothetical protein
MTVHRTLFASLFFFAVLGFGCSSTKDTAALLGDTTAVMELDPISVARVPLYNSSVFRRMDSWNTPNDFRTGSGTTGDDYWQQRADYVIRAKLDTLEHTLTGSETITYTNNSPDTLRYVWIQLDQNQLNPKMRARLAKPADDPTEPSLFRAPNFDGGYTLSRVEISQSQPLSNSATKKSNAVKKATRKVTKKKSAAVARTKPKLYLNDTMLRLDLDEPLAPESSVTIDIDWSYPIPFTGRTGREEVAAGWIYQIAQWYPRMCVYDDLNGWNTDQYLGQGEFYTEYGNFDLTLTVPANHICLATGVLQNPSEVLTATQRERLAKAVKSESVVMIIDSSEVGSASSRPKQIGELTWRYKAENVRDVAFASSAAFIWDAAGYNGILAQSLYPHEAKTLWRTSTESIRFSLKEFSEKWFPYPYPTMINVNGSVPGGMEYPMMIFVNERFNDFRLFAVTLHEVGHTWFPMIVQNNERRHAWMDEGFNSFMCYYGEKSRYPGRKARRGEAQDIVPYMLSGDHQPLMTHSHAIFNLGQNAYAKTAAALVALRETVLGSERFDAAFKEYIRRWKYKHPSPEDFFRTMEDAAGEDLAWFWRGWFYSTAQLDQSIDSVHQLDSADSYYTRLWITNRRQMVMPVQLEVIYADSSTERIHLPVEIWLKTNEFVYGFFAEKEVKGVILDPDGKLPDVDLENNSLFDAAWRKPEDDNTK